MKTRLVFQISSKNYYSLIHLTARLVCQASVGMNSASTERGRGGVQEGGGRGVAVMMTAARIV